MSFNGVYVISATMARDRATLDERINAWLYGLRARGGRIVDIAIRQSSDRRFHCVSVVVSYMEPPRRRVPHDEAVDIAIDHAFGTRRR